jgi:hypothetical protein
MLRICVLALCLTAAYAPSFGLDPEQPRVDPGSREEPKDCCVEKPQNCLEKCLIDEWFSRAYQPIYYVKNTGVDGETLTMNDETVWVIAGTSMYTVASWGPNSPIVISPSRWYSQYEYYITNIFTNETVTAKLSQGPFVEYSILIQQIDWNSGLVYLSNGTRWAIHPDSRMWPWQAGQAVLIGESSGPTGYILLNINENVYLEAYYIQ